MRAEQWQRARAVPLHLGNHDACALPSQLLCLLVRLGHHGNFLTCVIFSANKQLQDKRKAVSWVAALFNFYPQYLAVKVIHLIWADPEKGLRKKRHLERDIVQFETFLEAVISTLVMTYLLMRATSYAEGFEIIYNPWDPNPRDKLVFFLAFSSSVITSSLGLAKSLKVGPCRILPKGGFFSPRFIVIFFACLFTLVGKGLGLCSAVFPGCEDKNLVFTAIATFFLPGLLTGILASPHRGFLKTFLSHPSVFLLPTFSHFTFSSNKPCCQGADAAEKERFISF